MKEMKIYVSCGQYIQGLYTCESAAVVVAECSCVFHVNLVVM